MALDGGPDAQLARRRDRYVDGGDVGRVAGWIEHAVRIHGVVSAVREGGRAGHRPTRGREGRAGMCQSGGYSARRQPCYEAARPASRPRRPPRTMLAVTSDAKVER